MTQSEILDKLIMLGVGLLVCFILMTGIHRIFKGIGKKKDGIHIKFINSLVNVVVIIAFIYYALSLFDVTKDVSKVLLQSGTLLIAIVTFAAQQALGNVISGFSISMTKPFDVNEKVKVIDGSNVVAEGIITDITIRHTVIRTFDGQSAIIPNSVMDSSVIVNTNYTENVGNFLEIEISYDSDVDKAIAIIKKLAVEHPKTLNDDSMKLSVSSLTANGVIIKTTIWTKTLDDNFSACSDLRRGILSEFKKNGITIPYTTITVSNN